MKNEFRSYYSAVKTVAVIARAIGRVGLRPPAIIILLFCGGIEALLAQSPGPINTERPGFTSSPLTLPAGYWQIEGGYQYTRNTGSESSTDHTLPLALLRFGVYRNFELQLGWSGYSWTRSSGDQIDGYQDASVAAKWQLTEPDAALAVGLYASISLPTGDRQFSSDAYDPALGVYWTYSGRLNWFGAAILSESANQYEFNNAVGISMSLAQNTGAFIEYLGSFPEGQGPSHELLGALPGRSPKICRWTSTGVSDSTPEQPTSS